MAQTTSLTPLIVLIVIVVAAAGAGGGYLYYHNRVAPAPASPVVGVGENVTVNYIGLFGSGGQDGKVFDTSLYSVASNNASFPKSLEYSSRGGPTKYTPLAVHVGPIAPQAGYSFGGLSFITVVPGFWEGLVGMHGNETRTLVLPPNLAYGPIPPGCLRTLPLTQTLPVFEVLSGNDFQKEFPGVLATTGTTFTDPHYGWTVAILNANVSEVSIENLPYVGETAAPAGWPVVVQNVTSTTNGSGQITLENRLQPSDAGRTLGRDYLSVGPSGACPGATTGQFLVTAVNLTAGTFTASFAREVTGETLIFVVTVEDIFAPVAAPVA